MPMSRFPNCFVERDETTPSLRIELQAANDALEEVTDDLRVEHALLKVNLMHGSVSEEQPHVHQAFHICDAHAQPVTRIGEGPALCPTPLDGQNIRPLEPDQMSPLGGQSAVR